MSLSQDSPGGAREPVLNGWKEVAAYFGKGVRTVQRWEAELDLPVHRIAGRKADVVYAVRSELDEWRRGQENSRSGEPGGDDEAVTLAAPPATLPEPPAPSPDSSQDSPLAAAGPRPRSSRKWLGIGGVVALLALAVVAPIFLPKLFGASRKPADLRISGDQLVAFDAIGNPLWNATLPSPAPGDLLSLAGERRSGRPRIAIEDIDGDGEAEVLVVTVRETSSGEVVCYGSGGRLRWRRSTDRRARFGEGTMAAPWVPLFFAQTFNPDRSRSLWVSWANRPDFGAFVERIDPATGKPLSVFWSAGYVMAIATSQVAGRPVVLVGACNNEHKGASLAAYDLSLTAGAPPGVNPEYTCLDCPSARPVRFLVFPKTTLARELVAPVGGLFVSMILADAANQLKVLVNQDSSQRDVPVLYRFDDGLRLKEVEFLDSYHMVHRQLEAEGRLKPFGPGDAASAFPVLSWENGRFVELPPPVK